MSEPKIPAKPVKYNNIIFRSKLEAKWACFFDAMNLKWDYERVISPAGGGYRPDFRIHQAKGDVFFEVKGDLDPESEAKIEEFSHDHYILLSEIGRFPCDFRDYQNAFGNDQRVLSTYWKDETPKLLYVVPNSGFYQIADSSPLLKSVMAEMTSALNKATFAIYEEVSKEDYIAQTTVPIQPEQTSLPVSNYEKGEVIRKFREKQGMTMVEFYRTYISSDSVPKGTAASKLSGVETGKPEARYEALRDELYEKITSGNLSPIEESANTPAPDQDEEQDDKMTADEFVDQIIKGIDMDKLRVLFSILDCDPIRFINDIVKRELERNKDLINQVIKLRGRING